MSQTGLQWKKQEKHSFLIIIIKKAMHSVYESKKAQPCDLSLFVFCFQHHLQTVTIFPSDAFPDTEEQKAAWYLSYNRKEMCLAVWEEPLDSSVPCWVHILWAALSVPGSKEQSVPAGKDRKPFSSQLRNALIQDPELAEDEPTAAELFLSFFASQLTFKLFKRTLWFSSNMIYFFFKFTAWRKPAYKKNAWEA